MVIFKEGSKHCLHLSDDLIGQKSSTVKSELMYYNVSGIGTTEVIDT